MSNCTTNTQGLTCPPTTNWSNCKPWDISTQQRTNCLSDSYLQETIAIAGAQVNVHKLLGIHEQTKLFDLVGNGRPISSGDAPNYPASNAFDKLKSEWHSRQTSVNLTTSGFIGYDFGIIKLPNGRQQYGVEANVRYEINTIKIKQSANSKSRVTKARVERSENGTEWYGVAIVNLPDDDQLHEIHFKNSVPSRYWRLRPITFTGSECDSWGIQALELHERSATDISNIQDKILMENRDRNYDQAITIKGYYELVQANTDLQRFGIEIQANYTIKVHFNTCISMIGRPIVIGDILELPSETQYTADLRPVKRYLEVTDVTWDPSSYTPGWMPTMLLVTAMPAMASQETQDIFGDLSANIDTSGLFDNQDGNNQKYQDFSAVDQTIKAKALTDVPELGSDGSNIIREFEQSTLDAAKGYGIDDLTKLGFNRTGLYVEDAIPQNGASYTEDTVFPNDPQDGDYHRLIYTGLAENTPARLYRYSTTKNRWIYLETDKRSLYNAEKPIMTEYLTSPNKLPAREIK